MTDLATELSRTFPKMVASGVDADRIAYSRDLWPRHHFAVRSGIIAANRPAAIIWPESTEDVAALVRWARGRSIPIVPFGAGSGVCGGILPREDVLIVDMKRMTRWRDFDPSAPSLDVEAGHMGVPLETSLERRGFTVGHFPSSILCSTVGGWLAGRSAGQCSGYYGKIEDIVAELECVTGRGEIVTLKARTNGPNLVPLVIGSEGTLAVISSARLRLHPAPIARGFASWSFRTTEEAWNAMREAFQAGFRPAVMRLYDPFDAMLARKGGVRGHAKHDPAIQSVDEGPKAPGFGATVLKQLLRYPQALNSLIESQAAEAMLGGALVVTIFEGSDDEARGNTEACKALMTRLGGRDSGEAPARRWLTHRYSVSYRMSPVMRTGAFVDTMEVAAPWSKLGALYDGIRRALGKHVFVMAHFSHAYPDGCCIYFSFAGSAARDAHGESWDAACERTYDRAWRAALAAAVEAGGTIAHHHGVGRSKAPQMRAELGGGIEAVRALKKAFDPDGILNPGALIPPLDPEPYRPIAGRARAGASL